eukprot:11481297-Heterocapsa_arctica.AAC.1
MNLRRMHNSCKQECLLVPCSTRKLRAYKMSPENPDACPGTPHRTSASTAAPEFPASAIPTASTPYGEWSHDQPGTKQG